MKNTSANSEQSSHPSPLLKPLQAAAYLGVSPRTIWTLTTSGEIVCVRVRKCVRYTIADLDAYISRQRRGRR